MVLVGIFQILVTILKHMAVRGYHYVALLWLYITSFIIIVGAEINAIIHQRSVIKGKTPEEAALEHDDNNKKSL